MADRIAGTIFLLISIVVTVISYPHLADNPWRWGYSVSGAAGAYGFYYLFLKHREQS